MSITDKILGGVKSVTKGAKDALDDFDSLADKAAGHIASGIETVKADAKSFVEDTKAEAARRAEANRPTAYLVGYWMGGASVRVAGVFTTPSGAELAAEKANELIQNVWNDPTNPNTLAASKTGLEELFPNAQTITGMSVDVVLMRPAGVELGAAPSFAVVAIPTQG